MQIAESSANTPFHIHAYESGELWINKTCYQKPVVIFDDQLSQEILPSRFEELTVEHINKIADLNPELVLLGTGDKQQFIEHALLVPLVKKQIGIEVMSTLSAARTYNLLVEEGRKVLGVFFL